MRTPPPDIIAAAQDAQRAHGVPASVSISQWALESAWGARCTGEFNFFGIKAVGDQPHTLCWTHEFVGGKSVSCQQPFRNFASVAEAFDAHAALLRGARYAKAWPVTSVEAFVKAIAPVYATDPNYAANDLNLIRVDHFTDYDLPLAS